MPDAPPPSEVRDAASARLDEWLRATSSSNPVVEAVGPDTDDPNRRYLRFRGDDKDVSTLWFHLDQRTLSYECHVLSAPEENHAAFFEQLLRRNHGLHGVSFEIGPEDAVYLTGRMYLRQVDDDALDQVLGTVYQTIERSFRALLRTGFASRLAGRRP